MYYASFYELFKDPAQDLKEFFKQQRKTSGIEYGIELHPKHYEQLAKIFHVVRDQANRYIKDCEEHELIEPDDFETIQKMIALYQVIEG